MYSFLKRQLPLIEEDGITKLENSKILLLGLGGVGSMAFETLVRSGIGNITIVDCDKFDITNINRQLAATTKTIGEYKTEASKKRALEINEFINIKTINMFLTKDNINDLELDKYDYIIDAIDTISVKIELARICYFNNYKLISSMGTGNKLYEDKLVICDIYKTYNDKVSQIMRRELKKHNVKKLMVLSSTEVPIKIDYEKYDFLKSDKRVSPASISFVPNTAGIKISAFVIKELLNLNQKRN